MNNIAEYYEINCNSKRYEVKITQHNDIYYLKVVELLDLANISNFFQQFGNGNGNECPNTINGTFSIKENAEMKRSSTVRQSSTLYDIHFEGTYVKTVRFMNGINSRSMIKTILSLKNTDSLIMTPISEDEFIN